MSNLLIEELKFIKGLDPVADAFAGTVNSEAISLGKYGRVVFGIYKGVGATGTSVVTVQFSSDAAQTSPTAVPFKYRRIASGDTGSTVTAAAAAGFTTTAQSSEIYLIEVDVNDVPAGKPWVNMKLVESANDPVLGGIFIIAGDAKYAGDTLPTSIV